MDNKKQRLFPTMFYAKEIFSLIGFLFALLYTLRGICLTIYIITGTYVTHSEPEVDSGFLNDLTMIKEQSIPVLDILLLILCIFMLLHGILGVYYVLKTDLNFRKMFRVKLWFYLQIISAVAAVFVILALTRPAGQATAHSAISLILTMLLAVLASFHIANGFYNACITLGICVSDRSKRVARIVECMVAVFAMLQITILFI